MKKKVKIRYKFKQPAIDKDVLAVLIDAFTMLSELYHGRFSLRHLVDRGQAYEMGFPDLFVRMPQPKPKFARGGLVVPEGEGEFVIMRGRQGGRQHYIDQINADVPNPYLPGFRPINIIMDGNADPQKEHWATYGGYNLSSSNESVLEKRLREIQADRFTAYQAGPVSETDGQNESPTEAPEIRSMGADFARLDSGADSD
jgi:hypothetical protein